MTVLNRRKMERFALNLPAKLTRKWGRQLKPVMLYSSDISSGGAFFHTKEPFCVGTKVDIEVLLSVARVKKIKSNKALIRVKGVVVRGDGSGIAVRFNKPHQIVSVPG